MAALTEEQSILKDQASSWVETHLPVQKFREFRNSNSDGALTSRLVCHGRYGLDGYFSSREPRWLGARLPDLWRHFGQLGRQLCASPLFASAYVGATQLIWCQRCANSTGCRRSSMAAKY